jgi:hypothetical protein
MVAPTLYLGSHLGDRTLSVLSSGLLSVKMDGERERETQRRAKGYVDKVVFPALQKWRSA